MRHADDIISGRQLGVSVAAVTYRECWGRREGDRVPQTDRLEELCNANPTQTKKGPFLPFRVH